MIIRITIIIVLLIIIIIIVIIVKIGILIFNNKGREYLSVNLSTIFLKNLKKKKENTIKKKNFLKSE